MSRCLSGLALMGSAALFGCAASSPVPESAASALTVDDGLAADLNDHHRHHHQGGVTMFLALSLDTLGLPPERSTVVRKIQSDLFARMEPARLGEVDVLTALADGMVSGTIDKARIDAAVAKLEVASRQLDDATLSALAELHAVLTAPERAALIDKIEAHYRVFRQVNAEDGEGDKDPRARHLAELAAELSLSAEQVDKIGASFRATTRAAPAAMTPAQLDAHLQKLDTFRGDAFDPRVIQGGADANAHLAGHGAARMARFYEAVDPVLTPEQRAKLVLLLREHAAHKDTALVAAQ